MKRTTLAAGFLSFLVPVLVAPAQAAPGEQTAVLAGGCFWGMEGVFEHVRGVRSVTSGYAGGTRETATYDQVSSERTGHAEAVRIVFDPARVTYVQLLQVFFTAAHDPTQVNRQHPDEGPSYRSAIFPQTPVQARQASAFVAALDRRRAFSRPVATRVEQGAFYAAEAYHQDFMRRNPDHPYIRKWDVPRVAKLKATLPALYRP